MLFYNSLNTIFHTIGVLEVHIQMLKINMLVSKIVMVLSVIKIYLTTTGKSQFNEIINLLLFKMHLFKLVSET